MYSSEPAFRLIFTSPHGSVVVGKPVCFNIASETGENWVGSMRLPANGDFRAIWPPVLHCGDVIVVKSPESICVVGTNAVDCAGVERMAVICSPAKKNRRFFTIGPPIVPPN